LYNLSIFIKLGGTKLDNLTRAKVFDLSIYLSMKKNGIDFIFTVNKKDFKIFKDIDIFNEINYSNYLQLKYL
jgi:Mor family transcriptional regulator